MRAGFDAARIPAGLTRGLYVVAAAFFVLAAATHMLTYTPLGSADVLQTTSMLAFPVAFPVWGLMLFIIYLGRVPFDRVLSSLPMQVKVLGALLLAYVALDFFLMVALLPGQPVEQGGRFFFNEGGLVPTTAAAYRQGLAYQARLISGHELIFFGLAAVIGFQIQRLRSGKASLPEAPVPVIGAVVSPGPLDRQVVLETGLTPDECVTRLQSRLGPLLGGSWGRQMELWGLVSSEGFSLQLGRSGSTRQLVFASGTFAQPARGTQIQVWLQFKRWGLPAIVGSAVAFPIVGAVMDALSGGSHFYVELTTALAVFALVANLAFALYQRHRLLSLIERSLDAHRGMGPGGPN
jgi:heme exporter protein D